MNTFKIRYNWIELSIKIYMYFFKLLFERGSHIFSNIKSNPCNYMVCFNVDITPLKFWKIVNKNVRLGIFNNFFGASENVSPFKCKVQVCGVYLKRPMSDTSD